MRLDMANFTSKQFWLSIRIDESFLFHSTTKNPKNLFTLFFKGVYY